MYSRVSSIVLAALMSGCFYAQSDKNFYSAAHENFNYMGRVDLSNPDYARYDWPGVRVRFRFTGETLKLYFKGGERNYYDLVVDKKRIGVFHAIGDTVAEIGGLNGNETHFAQFIKRTEGEMGEARFYGVELSPAEELLPWKGNCERRIEFIGNSITCGYGAEADSPDDDFDPSTENVLRSYATLVAEAFCADYHIVAHSGLGVVRNYGDPQKVSVNLATMPQRYSRTLDMDDSEGWNFLKWEADVVVINLGTNDFSTTPHPEKLVFQSEYEELIWRVRKVYGRVPVFCVVGPMIGEPCYSYVEEVVQNFRKEYNDSNVHFIGLPPELLNEKDDLGADQHPSSKGHRKMASAILPVMSRVLGW